MTATPEQNQSRDSEAISETTIIPIPVENASSTVSESQSSHQMGLEKNLATQNMEASKDDATNSETKLTRSLVASGSLLAPGYEVLSVLGQGGMGVVYKARQKNLDRIVALKTILISQLDNPTSIARFEQEARTLAKVTHPNIVAAYDFGQIEGRLFLALEYVDGSDALKTIERLGSVKEDVAWGIIWQTASGLAMAATHGIVHRDIKPANLLLLSPPPGSPFPADWPLVKITDFGLASLNIETEIKERLTSTNTTLGSPHYMAPEQFEDAHVDHRADIYALGATTWHLLVGKPPFHGLKLSQMLGQKLSREATFRDFPADRFHPETVQLLQKLMAPKPQDRPKSYAEAIEQINRVLCVIGVRLGGSEGPKENLQATSAIPSLPIYRRREFVLVSGATTLGLLVGILNRYRPKAAGGLPMFEPVDNPLPLFNGQDLKGWAVLGGSWSPQDDEEGIRWLSGTNGQIEWGRPKSDTQHESFRFEVTLRPRKGAVCEVQVDFPLTSKSESPRIVCRVETQQLQIGKRIGSTGPLSEVLLSTSLKESQASAGVGLQFEFLESHWQIGWGDKILKSLPVSHRSNPARIMLAVVSESEEPEFTGWFGDIIYQPMKKKGPNHAESRSQS